MKIVISLLFSSFSLFSFAQDTSTKYYFKEVGWRIAIPSDFIPYDSAELSAANQVGKDTVNDPLRSDTLFWRNLFIAVKKDSYAFSASIMPFNEQRGGDYQKRIKLSNDKMITLLRSKFPGAALSFRSSSTNIDGVLFSKMNFETKMTDSKVLHFVELTKLYKGYAFSIQYSYMDELTRQQIETALEESKFDK